MARYIDADKVLLELQKFSLDTSNPYGVGYSDCLTAVEDVLNEAPTADVVEVKHGEWIYKHRHRGGFERKTGYDEFGNPHTVTVDNRYETDEPYCSECGKLGETFLNYCGNCGAKMDGGKEE